MLMAEIDILKSLADDTRLKIVKFLIDGEKCVCKIFPYVKKTQSTVSIHLNNLEKAGIVKSRRDGKFIYYSISDNRIIQVLKLLETK
jgi:DNA-binding transcriptional ArsR family regulator